MFQEHKSQSAYSVHGLVSSESDKSDSSKQSSVPLTATKTLPEMQIEKIFDMAKSAGNSLLLEKNGPNCDTANVADAKRPAPEFPSKSTQHQCSSSHPGGGHLVYVRRKAEAESGRGTGWGSQNFETDGPLVIKSCNQDETTQQKAEVKEHHDISTEVLSTSRASSTSLLAEKPSFSSSLAEPKNILSPSNLTPHITSPSSLPGEPQRSNIKHLHERYCHLQELLRELDQANQEDYIQMLRSLSSVELSRHAVDLETRSIQLSVEEAQELQRVRVFDILGRYSSIA